MFDDIRRVGEKIDGLLGTDIFPFNYPFSYTENFLQHLDKWEFAIPNKFLWLVNIEAAVLPNQLTSNTFTKLHPIPKYVVSQSMFDLEPGDNGQNAGAIDKPGSRAAGWDIDQGMQEITRDTFMKTGGGKHGCLLAQGVVLPGEQYDVKDVAINNNMGFLPGKVGGNRSGMAPLMIQWRESNRSFVDLVIRPWIILTSHLGLVARPATDKRNIKANISVVQLAKTYQYTPLVQRKIWRFYNCVPVSVDSKELTYQDGNNFDLFTTSWHYTHYTVESLPDTDMGAYMSKQGFKKFVKDMATKLLSKSRSFRKLQTKLAKVEEFVDKANKIKKKVNKVLGFFGGNKSKFTRSVPGESRGRSATANFTSDASTGTPGQSNMTGFGDPGTGFDNGDQVS
jgi:hypothetical protein